MTEGEDREGGSSRGQLSADEAKRTACCRELVTHFLDPLSLCLRVAKRCQLVSSEMKTWSEDFRYGHVETLILVAALFVSAIVYMPSGPSFLIIQPFTNLLTSNLEQEIFPHGLLNPSALEWNRNP